MKKNVKFLSITLVFCMLLSACGLSASAEEAETGLAVSVVSINAPTQNDNSSEPASKLSETNDGGSVYVSTETNQPDGQGITAEETGAGSDVPASTVEGAAQPSLVLPSGSDGNSISESEVNHPADGVGGEAQTITMENNFSLDTSETITDDIDKNNPTVINLDEELKGEEHAGEALESLEDEAESLMTDDSSNTNPSVPSEGGSKREESNSTVKDEDKQDSNRETEAEVSENAVADTERAGLHLTGDGNLNVLITGTLKSEGTPILIGQDVNSDNISITVWKIEDPVNIDGEEHVVLQETAGEDTGIEPVTETAEVTTVSRAVEEKIEYIIKVEPSQKDNITLGGTTESADGYNVAHQGDTVTMKIAIPDGYTLIGAYNGEGKEMPLEQNPETGEYFIVVPIEGGVYLRAEMEEKKEPSNDISFWRGYFSLGGDSDSEYTGWNKIPDTNSEPEETDQGMDLTDTDCSYTINAEDIFVVFKLNGGTLAGTAGPILIPAGIGDTVALLDEPTRPGYRFAGWEPCCPKITVTQPGETFIVKKTVVFVAQWAEEKSLMPFPTEEEIAGIERDEDDGPDVTETVFITEDNEEELNLNSITIKKEDTHALGVDISASQDVDVDDAISVTGGAEGATGIRVTSGGQTIKMEVETGDGMEVKSSGDSIGIQTTATNGGSVDVKFEGNMAVSSASGSSSGVSVQATGAGSMAGTTIEGNVQSSGTRASLKANGEGTASLTVDGNLG